MYYSIQYRLGKYLILINRQHPGGAELIKEYAGKDATSDFNNFGHSGDANNLMKLYKIGEIKVGIAYIIFVFFFLNRVKFTIHIIFSPIGRKFEENKFKHRKRSEKTPNFISIIS